MIARYTRPEMGRIWTDENKFRQWLEVELAASDALAVLGVVPAEAAALLRAHAGFSVSRIQEIEAEVKAIIDAAYVRAKHILTENIDELHRLARALLEHETLSGDEIKTIIDGGWVRST